MSGEGLHVDVSFVGPLRRPDGLGASARVRLPDDATVGGLLTALGYNEAERERLRVFVDEAPVPLSRELAAGTKLTVFLPLGGG